LGFSADWLALREPADLRARDSKLLAAAVSAAGHEPVILDLGSGTGSTIRAMSPFLPANTKWRVVDNDPELLKIASLAAPNVSVFCQDLTDLENLPLDGVSLVTGSALLDLVSLSWLSALISRISAPCYFALSYDGVMHFELGHPLDQSVLAAFNAHQLSDKGFGPALGPAATDNAKQFFEKAGFSVLQSSSNWQLGKGSEELQSQLIEGIANAALEAGEPATSDWLAARSELVSVSECSIGHQDLLAIPASARVGA
jgi:SAM-dependent methyltransferase